MRITLHNSGPFDDPLVGPLTIGFRSPTMPLEVPMEVPVPHPTNREIADALEQTARILELHGDNPFRVRAFRVAARTVEVHDASVAGLLSSGGPQALRQLPGVG